MNRCLLPTGQRGEQCPTCGFVCLHDFASPPIVPCGQIKQKPHELAFTADPIEGATPTSSKPPPATNPNQRTHPQQQQLLAICRSNVCGQYLEGDLCGWQKSKGRAGALMSPRGIPSKAANCKHWPNG